MFEIKIFFAVLSVLVSLGVFVNYIRTVLKGETKPHTYTWLIWFITQSVAVAGMWYGNGGWGVLSLTVSTVSVFCVMLFSLKYGTKNITKSDTAVLLLALFAVFVWVQLDNPFLAVTMVTIIDVLGYIPSWRKSVKEPWAETITSWGISPIGNLFAILALTQYNYFTLTYPISLMFANLVLVAICLYYRTKVSKPNV